MNRMVQKWKAMSEKQVAAQKMQSAYQCDPNCECTQCHGQGCVATFSDDKIDVTPCSHCCGTGHAKKKG